MNKLAAAWEHVEIVARPAALVGETAFKLKRHPAPGMNVGHRFDVALPLLECVDHDGSERNVTAPALDFGAPILRQASARWRTWI